MINDQKEIIKFKSFFRFDLCIDYWITYVIVENVGAYHNVKFYNLSCKFDKIHMKSKKKALIGRPYHGYTHIHIHTHIHVFIFRSRMKEKQFGKRCTCNAHLFLLRKWRAIRIHNFMFFSYFHIKCLSIGKYTQCRPDVYKPIHKIHLISLFSLFLIFFVYLHFLW